MPKVSLNAVAPDFTLADFRGETVSLSDFKGRSNVLIVFNRTFS
jgi:peroxiredoxin